MDDSDEKDKLLKTPPGAGRATTPFGTPASSEATLEFDLTDATLAALRQRYDLLAELGRGGMGAVYKARDRETGDVVAVKVLLPEIAARPDLIERFKSELLLARRVTHKNVCRVYDLNRFGAVVGISMEYIEGESLRSLLNRVDGVSIHHGLNILRQVFAGLSEAHAQGVVHRDLKPENILLGRDGTVKVMDFGIARSLDSQVTGTGTGMLIGTPAYMSPEQAEGKSADARSDIYALGLVMYEMFTGRHPFGSDTPVGFAVKQLHEAVPPPRALEPDLPERIDRAIEKCLAKEPKKRFQSVAELEAALSEQLLPVLAPSALPVPAPHLSRWGRSDWLLFALGGVGLFYFLAFSEVIFPASKMRLEVDAITARREVEALANRLGRPLPSFGWSQLEFDARQYQDTVIARVLDRTRRNKNALDEISRIELPLRWRVNFSVIEHVQMVRLLFESPPDYAFVDRKGRVVELHSQYAAPVVTQLYRPASVEERRRIAREVAEAACGPLPGEVNWIETAGGEFGADYEVAWVPVRPVNSPPWAHVSLRAEKVASLACQYESAAPPSELAELRGALQGAMEYVWRFGLLFIFGQFLFTFALGQGYRSADLFWKRAPLALLLGFSAAWILPRAFAVRSVSPPALVTAGLAIAALVLLALVVVEYLLLRRVPGQVASSILFLRGQVLEPAVGLAVVRGALAGLLLAGLHSALVHLTLWFQSVHANIFPWDLFGVLFDPSAVGYSLETAAPGLFAVSSALFCGCVMGFLFLGGTLAGAQPGMKKSKNKRAAQAWLLFGLAAGYPVVSVALRLPSQEYFSAGAGPFWDSMALGLVLAVLVLRYDVLTAVVAVTTATLWILNFPLLQILREVGNIGQWMVFLGWLAVVLGAAGVAFRAEIAHALQQKKAELR